MIPVKITQLSTNKNPIHLTLDVGWVEKYKTVTGNPIVISDGVKDTLLKKLQMTLEPKQSGSGTPSPSNIRPISGWDEVETNVTGVNLLDDSKKQMSGNQLAIGYSGVDPWTNGVSAHLKAGTYTFSVETADGTDPAAVYVGYSGETGHKFIAYSNKVTFTLTEEKDIYVWAYKFGYKDIGVDAITHAQLELGSTATSYEPYQGHTYTTDLPQTVYGGTLDVVSGVLTVDRAIVDLGTMAWTMPTQGQFRAVASSIGAKVPTNPREVPNAICSQYEATTQSGTWADGQFSFLTNGYIYFIDSNYTSASDFKTAMSGVQLVYELANPTTIQCDPQTVSLLAGENVIMGDGDMEITYRVKASA